MKEKIMNDVYKHRYTLLAMFLVSSMLIIVEVFCGITFESNDDTGIMKTLSGYALGESTYIHDFCHVIIAYVLVVLYKMFPVVSWYSVYSIGIVWVTYLIIFRFVLKKLEEQKMIYKIAVLIITCGCLLYCARRISFTANAALLGTAAIILLLESIGSKKKSVLIALSALFMLASSLVRFASFKAIVPFWGLIYLYSFIREKRPINRKKVYKYMMVIFVLFVVIFGCKQIDSFSKQEIESQEYLEFQKYRSIFSDYACVTYDEDPEFYESIGWSRELYVMSRNWCYLDELFNTENLKAIIEQREIVIKETPLEERFNNTIDVLVNSIRPNSIYFIIVCIIIILFIGVMISKVDKYTKCLCVLTVLLFLAEVFYLAWKGRFVLRAFLCAGLPALSIVFLGIFSIKRQMKMKSLSVVAVLFCLILVVPVYYDGFLPENNTHFMNDVAEEIEEYCSTRIENLYIYDTTLVNDTRFWIESDKSGYNRMFYGGSTIHNRNWYRRLQINGYESFDTHNLFDENVYYITLSSANIFETGFGQYLYSVDSTVSFELVDKTLLGVHVYKISINN